MTPKLTALALMLLAVPASAQELTRHTNPGSDLSLIHI